MEGYEDGLLQEILASSRVKLAHVSGAEVVFEPVEPRAKAAASPQIATSAPQPREEQKERRWWPFASKKGVAQLAPMLVVVVAMNRPSTVNRPVFANTVRVVDSAPALLYTQRALGEYIPSTTRYPLLMGAIERGRLAEAGRPDPRRRKLRDTAEAESLTEAQQIAFGRLGDPPSDHLRRPQLP
jgi:hypothetical protein